MPSSDVTLLTRSELERLVPFDREALAAVEEAFSWLGRPRLAMPPVMRVDFGASEVDVKTAYVPGLPAMAVKIATGFYDNPARGLPSTGGLMVVLDTSTGAVQAVLLDGGYLTELRTALAGAVAAKHLAREDARVAAVLGAGAQARHQVRALLLARDVREVLVWGRRRERAEACARALEAELGVRCRAAEAEEAVRAADVVVTTTPASEPILRGRWLKAGAHVTAMGSDAPHKRELDAEVLERAAVVACDWRPQSLAIGELHHANIAVDRIVELGELITKRRAGRTGRDDITVCDLSGLGVQDTAIALHALARRGAGDAP